MSHRAGILLPAAGTASLLVVLALYVADLVHHLPGMTQMRDLAVYRAGGLITRHVTPPYNPHAYAPLYAWHGPNAVSFTYSPFAAIVFAAGSLLPRTALRWAAISRCAASSPGSPAPWPAGAPHGWPWRPWW